MDRDERLQRLNHLATINAKLNDKVMWLKYYNDRREERRTRRVELEIAEIIIDINEATKKYIEREVEWKCGF